MLRRIDPAKWEEVIDSWRSQSIRASAIMAFQNQSLEHWSEVFGKIGELEQLLFHYHYYAAALQQLITSSGDWGEDRLEAPPWAKE